MAAKKQSKQHVVRYKKIKAYKASHPDIRSLKRHSESPSIHGNKVWDSSFVLMDFLTQFPPEQHKVVLDVGCGWGVLSCFVAKHFDAAVIGVDADAAVKPFFEYHEQQNNVDLNFAVATIDALKSKALRNVDVVLGTDICFWPSLDKDWRGLIKRAKKAGVSQILLADPGRSPFWKLVAHCEKQYDAEIWSHDIKKPMKSEKYILEINF